MSRKHVLRVGLCGIGLDAYWKQFAGLEDRLKGYVAQVASWLMRPGVEVVNLGLIDSPKRSREAGHDCRREDIDLLFLYVTTYALSNTILPFVQRASVPVVVLNLQPEAAIDCASFNKFNDRTAMTASGWHFAPHAPVPEIANLFARADIPFHQVTGVLGPLLERLDADFTASCINIVHLKAILQAETEADKSHLGTVRTSQRRFAPTLAHITGISGPHHRNTQTHRTPRYPGSERAPERKQMTWHSYSTDVHF